MFQKASLILGGLALAGATATSALAGPAGTTIIGEKTAATTWTQINTYSWSLEKTPQFPDQVTWVIPQGSSAQIGFTVRATRTGPVVESSNTAIIGEVCLTNTGLRATQGLQLMDQLEQEVSPGVWSVVGPPVAISAGGELPAGERRCISYSVDYQIVSGQNYRNHAIASIDNFLGYEGMQHSIDVFGSVNVETVIRNIDASIMIEDLFQCPAGFSCSQDWLTQTPTDTTTYPCTVTVTNDSAECGQRLEAVNTVRMAVPTAKRNLPGVPESSVSSFIYTGSCNPVE